MTAVYYQTWRPSIVAIITRNMYVIDATEAAEHYNASFPPADKATDDELIDLLKRALQPDQSPEASAARYELATTGIEIEFWTLHRNREQ